MSAWETSLDWLPAQIRAALHGSRLLDEYMACVILAQAHADAGRAGVDGARAGYYRERLAVKLDEVLAWWESEGRRCA